MAYYTNFGQVNDTLKKYYEMSGKRLQFPEVIDILYKREKLYTSSPHRQELPMFSNLGETVFTERVNNIFFQVRPQMSISKKVTEEDIIPLIKDVFIILHPKYTRPYPHSHDYFELDYVVNGSCTFHFEDEIFPLSTGELCIISPGSQHDIEINDDSTVYCIMIKRSTFTTTFFALLSRDDALSLFFRTIFKEKPGPNYMLFRTESCDVARMILQNAFTECYRGDAYSNSCCINWINLLFAFLLRDENITIKFHDYPMGTEFSPVLHYIRNNYRSLTLTELAEHFHYSKPHLCTLIKQNTGVSFTELVKRLRMTRAEEYLVNTDMNIGSIAASLGYSSTDHFSRVFRKTYGISPVEYRRKNYNKGEQVNPFL
jgi:AraC-like DNA-binding protein/mannose-6-phosphate isomerase-like protein (cupin superfamily)